MEDLKYPDDLDESQSLIQRLQFWIPLCPGERTSERYLKAKILLRKILEAELETLERLAYSDYEVLAKKLSSSVASTEIKIGSPVRFTLPGDNFRVRQGYVLDLKYFNSEDSAVIQFEGKSVTVPLYRVSLL